MENITNKVKGFERNVIPKSPVKTGYTPVPIRVVSSFGANDFLESTLAKYETIFRESAGFCSLGPNYKRFEYIYRTAPKLGGHLSYPFPIIHFRFILSVLYFLYIFINETC